MVLAEEDAVAEEGEACASVHLSFDQLRFGVHSFCTSIVEWSSECGVDGVAVELEAAGERVDIGQVFGSGLVDPAGQALIVAGSRGQKGGEVADEGGEGGHLGTGAGRGVDAFLLVIVELARVGEQVAGKPSG